MQSTSDRSPIDRTSQISRAKPIGWILPSDRLEDSEARIDLGGLAIFSSVSKGYSKKICQDTVAVAVLDKAAVIGVFDGFGSSGHLLSKELGRQLISVCERRAQWIENGFDSKALLRRLIKTKEVSEARSFPKGGSTASIVIVGQDGRFSASRLGDSPVYGAGGRVECLFDPNFVVMPTRDGMKEVPLSEAKMDPDIYCKARNGMMSSQSVTANCNVRSIRTRIGRLAMGSILIAASDGLPKNMPFGIDENGHVAEAGGCEGIFETIYYGLRDGISAGQSLATKVRGRMLSAMNGDCAVHLRGRDALRCADDDLSIVTIGPPAR